MKSAAASKENAPTVWEYHVHDCWCWAGTDNSLFRILSNLGKEGWELVHMFPTGKEQQQTLVFKRPQNRRP